MVVGVVFVVIVVRVGVVFVVIVVRVVVVGVVARAMNRRPRGVAGGRRK